MTNRGDGRSSAVCAAVSETCRETCFETKESRLKSKIAREDGDRCIQGLEKCRQLSRAFLAVFLL